MYSVVLVAVLALSLNLLRNREHEPDLCSYQIQLMCLPNPIHIAILILKDKLKMFDV